MDNTVKTTPNTMCTHTDHAYLPPVASSCMPDARIKSNMTLSHLLHNFNFSCTVIVILLLSYNCKITMNQFAEEWKG